MNTVTREILNFLENKLDNFYYTYHDDDHGCIILFDFSHEKYNLGVIKMDRFGIYSIELCLFNNYGPDADDDNYMNKISIENIIGESRLLGYLSDTLT